jgi:amino acid transporter/nucleotide-binding universal stress UspA family protein
MSHGTEPNVSSELSRELSLFHIVMMGLGMMIGAGVFLGVGNAIWQAGPGGVVLTFALNGVLALFTAMSYAELSSAVPRAGGAYNFARIGFGRGPSFLAGWMEWFASSVAGSMYALTFSIYTLRYVRELTQWSWLGAHMGLAVKGMALVVAVFFLYINYRGASETGKVGAFFTLGQTIFLVVIGLIGLWVLGRDPARLSNFQPWMPRGWSKLLVTMGFTYVAFEGYEVISQAGDEAIDPRRNLPKAMLYSVFFVTLTYVLVAVATVVSVKAGSPGVEGAPWEWIGTYREQGFGEAVARLLPSRGLSNLLLTLAVIFASTSALNATIYSATRASYALGRDRMLPGFFSRISKKRRTPWVALLFTGGIVILVAELLPTMHVASSASIMFLSLFFVVNLSVIKIRRNMGEELHYGFVMPLFPLFPILAIVLQTILAVWLVHMSLVAWIVAPVWIVTGLLLYRFYARSRALTTEDEIHVFEEEEPRVAAPAGYSVMVPVANPDNALNLAKTAYNICGAKQAQVQLLHLVPVPEQVPLQDAERYMWPGREAIVESMLYLAPLFPVSTTVRYCRNVARGIVSAVREKKTDLLLMGWHGRPKGRSFSIGSTIDAVMERVPCNVVIVKECGFRKFHNVLVPVAGGRNSAYALEIAGIMLAEGGEMTLLHVRSERRGRGAFDVEAFLAEQTERLPVPRERVRTKVVARTGVVGAILKESEDYDLVVMGATDNPYLYQALRHNIPETVARNCKTPLIMVKEAGGLHSWIKRWV